MKRIILLLALLTSYWALCADLEIAYTVKKTGGWSDVEAKKEFKMIGAGGNHRLIFEFQSEADSYYLVTYESYASNPEYLRVSIDKGSRHNTKWSLHRTFIYAKEAGDQKITFETNSREDNAGVRNLIIERLTPQQIIQKLFSDCNFESEASDITLWRKNYSSPEYTCSLVPSVDFHNGVQSMKMSALPDKKASIISGNIPAVIGNTINFSFWAKGSDGIKIQCDMEVWSPIKHTGGHLNIRKTFELTENWSKYDLKFDIPNNTEKYPDINDHAARVKFMLNPFNNGFVLLDDVSCSSSGGL